MKGGQMEHRRHEILSDLATQAKVLAHDFNMQHDKAEQLGMALADYMATHWGGQLVCFPKDAKFRRHKRDIEMYHDFRGHNYSELATKYDMTERGVRKVIDRMTRIMITERQGDMFQK